MDMEQSFSPNNNIERKEKAARKASRSECKHSTSKNSWIIYSIPCSFEFVKRKLL